ncbi:MAG: hypothetical protein HY006_03770 [Candidatus Sungbacteria bacterium]|nr:hypothetical protein [Candidatus Sungbacteria bacterium]
MIQTSQPPTTPTTFTLSNNVLYLQEGTSPQVALTAQGMQVVSLTFRNVAQSAGNPPSIRIEMTVRAKNNSGIPQLNYEQQFLTTATRRKK